MIGKIIRTFSNDWKKLSREESGRIFSHKGYKGHKEGGEESGRDVYIEKQENRFADIEKRVGCGGVRDLP